MSSEEIEIYKHLPSIKEREEFIRDFWIKRDPTPDTKINENEILFQKRIEYANKWFNEGSGSKSNRMGWNTVRGRIYLQLGEPTYRRVTQRQLVDDRGGLVNTKREPMEIWDYIHYKFRIAFVANEYGVYDVLGGYPVAMGRALRESKSVFNYRISEKSYRQFKYSVKYEKKELIFKFPVKNLSFKQVQDYMETKILVTIRVYQNYKRINQFQDSILIKEKKKDVLNKKYVKAAIPASLSKKGKYFIETILKETNSLIIYRSFISFKI
jgi:GWxTD domain-containing protein